MSWEQMGRFWVVWLHCWGWHSNLSRKLSPALLERGRSALHHRFAGNTPNERLFGSALPSPGGPIQLSSIPWRAGCAGTFSMNLLCRILSGTRQSAWPPPYGLSRHHPQWETLLIWPPEPWWLHPVELAPAEGMAGCTQPEPAACSS